MVLDTVITIVNYDHHMFIVQATALANRYLVWKQAFGVTNRNLFCALYLVNYSSSVLSLGWVTLEVNVKLTRF